MRKKKNNKKRINIKIVIRLIILTFLSVVVGFIISQSYPKYMNSPSKENCRIGEYYKPAFLFFSDGGCERCPSGKYCPGDNKYHECSQKGTKTIGEGRTSENDCKYCKDETKYYDGYECKSCKQGYYCQGGSLHECPAGKTTKSTGNKYPTACVCEAGRYLSGKNCEKCPTGFTSPVGSTSIGQCTMVVNAGSYIECNGNCTVKKCTGNTISAKQTVKYSKNLKTKCNITCSGDKVANDSHTGCSCKAGTYASGDGCKKCPQGFTSSIGASSISECKGIVPAGKSITCSANGCTVKTCMGNTYSTQRTVNYSTSLNSPCTSCPGNKVANESHTGCIESKDLVCPIGEYKSNGKCVACPKCNGSVKCFTSYKGSTSPNQCFGTVPAGKYITCSGSGCTVNLCKGNTISKAQSVKYKSGLNTQSYCTSCGTKKANSTHTVCV